MNLRGRNKVDPSFNMSSMTDIVFLLLIFFMLTSTLVTVSAIDVLLPKAGGKTENSKSVAVSINSKSQFYIDKTLVSSANLENEILKSVGSDKKKNTDSEASRTKIGNPNATRASAEITLVHNKNEFAKGNCQ